MAPSSQTGCRDSFARHFDFFLETASLPVKAGDAIWAHPLPCGPDPATAGDRTRSVTYGQLFRAVADFLKNTVFRHKPELPAARPQADPVRILLVKHGAFYHPCRIEAGPGSRPQVVNVAVSQPGRNTIDSEFKSLARLGKTRAAGFVPQVYLLGRGRCSEGHELPMFLGQWLDGFREFHLGIHNGRQEAMVWNPDGSRQVLATIQVREIMRQAAFILAACYDPISMEAVSGFHHAAGDFVVRPGRGDCLQVRLISIRDYRPLAGPPDQEADLQTILDGLLVQMLKTSLQLRLDRLDGVGGYALYPSRLLDAFWEGFAEGVAWSLKDLGIPAELTSVMADYFRNHSLDDWMEISGRWLQKFPAGSPERRLLETDLENHMTCLRNAVSR